MRRYFASALRWRGGRAGVTARVMARKRIVQSPVRISVSRI